jgi:hypothetical protein
VLLRLLLLQLLLLATAPLLLHRLLLPLLLLLLLGAAFVRQQPAGAGARQVGEHAVRALLEQGGAAEHVCLAHLRACGGAR